MASVPSRRAHAVGRLWCYSAMSAGSSGSTPRPTAISPNCLRRRQRRHLVGRLRPVVVVLVAGGGGHRLREGHRGQGGQRSRGTGGCAGEQVGQGERGTRPCGRWQVVVGGRQGSWRLSSEVPLGSRWGGPRRCPQPVRAGVPPASAAGPVLLSPDRPTTTAATGGCQWAVPRPRPASLCRSGGGAGRLPGVL